MTRCLNYVYIYYLHNICLKVWRVKECFTERFDVLVCDQMNSIKIKIENEKNKIVLAKTANHTL